MKKLLNFALISVLLTGISLAQNSAQPSAASESQNTAFRLEPETIIRVELAKSVDAKKAKVGDEVMAKTIDDFLSDKNEVLAPKGSKVLGHVAEVSPHQGESASTLGIAFDKIVLKNGTEVRLKASIQAIGPPESNAAAGNDNLGAPANSGGMSPMSSPGRGAYGGTTPNPGGTMPGSVNNPGAAAQDASQSTSPTAAINGRLTPNAQGVVGMSGLSLSTGAAQDSLLSSPKHNVKLDSGTQMILRVTS
jgi:hypothetical protein